MKADFCEDGPKINICRLRDFDTWKTNALSPRMRMCTSAHRQDSPIVTKRLKMKKPRQMRIA